MVNPLTLLVPEAYRNAEENGYDLSKHTDDEVAADMMAYHDEIAEYNFHNVIDAVKLHRRNIGYY